MSTRNSEPLKRSYSAASSLLRYGVFLFPSFLHLTSETRCPKKLHPSTWPMHRLPRCSVVKSGCMVQLQPPLLVGFMLIGRKIIHCEICLCHSGSEGLFLDFTHFFFFFIPCKCAETNKSVAAVMGNKKKNLKFQLNNFFQPLFFYVSHLFRAVRSQPGRAEEWSRWKCY